MALVDDLIKEGWLKTPRIIKAFRQIKRADFLPEDPEGVALWRPYGASMEDLAELNEALPIGFGQTISQPLVVAFMLELLQPQAGEKILDIGSGSGWTTALLAHIVSQEGIPNFSRLRRDPVAAGQFPISKQKGKVIAIEIVPELKEFGEKNVAKYNFIEKGIAEFICTDGSKGYPNIATRPELAEGFDKILASAAVNPIRNEVSNGAEKLPSAWKEQLKINGRIVTPIASSIWLFIKKKSSFAEATEDKAEFEEKEYPGFAFVPLVEK